MWVKIRKNKGKLILITVITLLFSILIECLLFNFQYWTSERALNQTLMPDDSAIVLQGIRYEDGSFKITGENPYIKISIPEYCNYVRINIEGNVQDYKINVQHVKDGRISHSKEHMVSDVYKKTTVLEVKDELSDVLFVPDIPGTDNQTAEFVINSFSIDNTFIINYYRISAIFCSIMLIFILILFRQELCRKLHIVFLLIVVLLGINISVTNAVNHSYDEREHFLRAYEVSNFDFGLFGDKEIPWIENSDDFVQKGRLTYSGVSYQNIAEKNDYMKLYGSTEYANKESYDSTASTYLFIPYIPGAIGILLGRLIGLPFIWTFYLGRITSLLGYSAICAWCIKHVKYGKKLLFTAALLPALLFIATSYSADTYTLAFSFVALTIWIDMLTQKNVIKISQIVGFIVAVIIATMCKVTYVPLCLLFLAVPLEKFSSKAKGWFSRVLVVGGSGIFSVFAYLYSSMKDMNQWQMPGVDVGEQIIYIFTHLLTYLYTICNDLTTNTIDYITDVTGNLAYNEPLKSIWTVFLILMITGIAVMDNESDRLVLGLKEKIILALSVICSWGLVATALYITFTPVGSNTIQGIQGRYWGPLLVPMLFLLKNRKIICNVKEETLNYVLSWSMMIPVMVSLWTILNYCCA